MSFLKYNPFASIASQISDGFTYLGTNLPDTGNDMTVINNNVINYINTAIMDSSDPITPSMKGAMYSVVPTAVNDYSNNEILNLAGYPDPDQQDLIRAIAEGIRTNSIDSLASYFDSATELVVQSDIDVSLKTPVFVAIIFAQSSYAFWMDAISTTNGWTRFLNSNVALNYPNVPYWVSASFEGALSGFAQMQASIGSPNILNDIGRVAAVNAALGGAIGLTASKILLNVVQKPNLLALTNVISATGNAYVMEDKQSKRCPTMRRCCDNTNQASSTCDKRYCAQYGTGPCK